MKYLFLILLLSLTAYGKAQSSNSKQSRDSIRYYQTELHNFLEAARDSLKNSNRYKELTEKLNYNNQKNKMTIELAANIGLYFTDFKNLNERLRSIGQREVKTMVPSIGVSLALGFPVMTYGVELGGYAFDNSTASFKGAHGRLFLATNLFRKNRISLTPQIGFVGSFLNMYVNKPSIPTNFDDLFTTQANTIQLTHSQNYLDFGLGLKVKGGSQSPLYWQFLRMGYRYGLTNAAWSMKGGNLQNAPVDRNNQFYIQFCIGFER